MMTPLRDALPKCAALYADNAPLKDLVWFRAGAGGNFVPACGCRRSRRIPREQTCGLPVTVIGVGSNLLVRDGGIPGVVIRLPASFGRLTDGGMRFAPARRRSTRQRRAAADAGIAGLEFLRGIPGTIGGALRMNAGCYGREIKDIFVEATAIDAQGRKIVLKPADMGFVYRKANAPDEDSSSSKPCLQGHGRCAAIRARMNALVEQREASQPVKSKTGGSTFKNPDSALSGRKAWQLIDEAGCRGLTHGGAQVSEKHCNFLINTGDATAGDIEALGEDVCARVKAKFGVELEWEIKRVGVP
jgi:UDP-N-acetylmuramate dehydrogenase